MRYDLVVENLEAADEILFRLLENSLHIEEKREIMLADLSRIKSRIRRAELFLKNDESKQPQPPDFANTMLGEVPPVVNDGTEEISKAVEGATPVVRQNAQTKEVCPFCKSENTEQIEGINYCCNNCESTWANW